VIASVKGESTHTAKEPVHGYFPTIFIASAEAQKGVGKDKTLLEFLISDRLLGRGV
jgi:hypothetical protein